uniref:Cystatin fetuin-A-type domain-containing protein n=1 Tax=Dicentrarchus labrax TaxID=13489 RepID=A0A8P4GCL2_DICLA
MRTMSMAISSDSMSSKATKWKSCSFQLHTEQTSYGNKPQKGCNSNTGCKVDEGCNIELQLHLLETTCHTVNPKHFEDCETRMETDQAVEANCTVMMTVTNNDAKVTKYECDTKQVKIMMRCPDCPILIPLNNTNGLKSVHEAVTKFNQNSSNTHYYVLQEVGRIQSGYMMAAGMGYWAEFVLVETPCPWGSRIVPEACKPLCHDRAHHAFCRSSSTTQNGLGSVECEFYPPTNTTALGPGEQEPVCRPHHVRPHDRPGDRGSRPHSHSHGPPPHNGDRGSRPHSHGTPPHAGDRGSRPHSHGSPPHAGDGGRPPHSDNQDGQERQHHQHPFSSHHPFRHFHSCHRMMTDADPALHPICPWPFPEPRPHPHPRES